MMYHLILVPFITIPVGLLYALVFKVTAGMWTRIPRGDLIAPFTKKKLKAKRLSVLLIV